MNTSKVKEGSVALIAFGGNAFFESEQKGSIEEQRRAAGNMCLKLLTLIDRGYELVITHGNGPQVGNLLIQRDMTKHKIPEMPLDVLVAQTEGSLGYILQQELLNQLRIHRKGKYVVTLVTQVLVDKDDPAFVNPTKPVGPFYTKEEVDRLLLKHPDWRMMEDAGRGYRRTVPSPEPKRIIQSHVIRSLCYSGNVVIALGGGGIPMIKDENENYIGIEAVIDKDLSSAVLANDIKADLFVILTGVNKAFLNYGKETQRPLEQLTYSQAKQYMRDGHFPAGSMGPKISAVLYFLENGGRRAVITNAENLESALDGRDGTHFVWS
ncbi:MAG: carbamate kinase [Actinobacteria bacterium]|nr:carbamate kinase [Actinomycetota bacterium]